jgi:hypothetical protein
LNFKFYLIFSVIFVATLIPTVFAEEQVPGFVVAVEGDPYYFSANDFGIGVLQYFERDYSPYLVPGITDKNSSVDEIMIAYNENKKQTTDNVIVSDDNRALVFQVTFSNGDISEKQIFTTFQKYTHIQNSDSTSSQKGLKLESLLSSENKWFYENIISRYINSGDDPEPFDIDVNIITGDTSTLQIWQYSDCVVTEYTPYLDENLAKLKFVGSLVSEIRDKTNFDCAGFSVDFNLDDASSALDATNLTSSKTTQAKQIIVEFSGGALEDTIPAYSFSKFTPIKQVRNLPIFVPGYAIDAKPGFSLQSLPSKDKEDLYVGISKYILPGKDPEPFDASVHLASGSGEIIQTWKYSKCSVTNYSTFFIDNLLFFKFKQTFGSEIRDKTNFDCTGLEFDVTSESSKQIQSITPNNFERAQTFVVNFEGPDISPEKTITSFSRFAPISNEQLPLLLPNSIYGEKPKFYLESLPNKDNQWYYQLMSRYINAGSVPEPFSTTINVVTGDNTTIQEWKYTDCEVLEYKPFLEDLLFKRKFTTEFNSEIRDRTIFECNGYAFDGKSKTIENTREHALSYADFIPNQNERAQRYVVTLSDGDFTKPLTMHTVGKFIPTIEQRGEISYRFVEGKATVYSNEDEGSSVSTTVSTNSMYDMPTIFGKKDPCEKKNPPPHCVDPDHPGNNPCDKPNPPPKCDDPGEPVDPTPEPVEPIPEPVPETPDSSYYVAIDEPHLSKIETNTHQKSLKFTLESLSSKDKEEFYEFTSQYYNPGMKKPQPFDVTVDLVTGDGSVLQSWEYSKCDLESFDTYLQDNLLYFTMNGKKATSEIKDKSSFDCIGFSVDFDESDLKYENVKPVLDNSDRAMFYLAHVDGGEFKSQKSTALLQKVNTLSENNLMLTGLSNVINEDYYDFVGKYVNTGKDPENFDFRYDVVTGDGTVLFSGQYSDCQISDFSTFYNDQIFYVKFVPSLQPEIRSQGVLDCIGMDLLVSPLKEPTFDTTGNLKKLSPSTQRLIDIPNEETVCNDGKSVMIRPPKDIAVCIKDEHVANFEDKGWILSKFSSNHSYSQNLIQPIPTFDERAISFSVTFEGTDIAPAKISDTFSKFVPINGESRFLSPRNSLDDTTKQFYLESLPSKDKDWYYELLSQYINPGKTPEPFNISVQVLAGNESLIQEWNYSECTRSNYELFLDDSLLTYKFHQKWDSEIKDRTFFECVGLSLNNES